MKRLLHTVKTLTLVIGLLLFCQLSWSAPTLTKEQYNQRLEQWKKLTPEQQKTILNNYKQYQKLPAPEKEVVKKNFQEWQKLPSPDKEKFRQEVRTFKKLPPKQKAIIIETKRQRLNRERAILDKPQRDQKLFENKAQPRELKKLKNNQDKLPRKVVGRPEKARIENPRHPSAERRNARRR